MGITENGAHAVAYESIMIIMIYIYIYIQGYIFFSLGLQYSLSTQRGQH